MKTMCVKTKRYFKPYHDLLSVAYIALDNAVNKKSGFHYYAMITITFSALAIEALANSFGEYYIDRWEDYQNASPMGKIRLLCSKFNIEIDFGKKPWQTFLWLKTFRNTIAHAKPEHIELNEKMSAKKWEENRKEMPPSKLDIWTTLENAKDAYGLAQHIENIFCENIPEEDLEHFSFDGSESVASVVDSREGAG